MIQGEQIICSTNMGRVGSTVTPAHFRVLDSIAVHYSYLSINLSTIHLHSSVFIYCFPYCQKVTRQLGWRVRTTSGCQIAQLYSIAIYLSISLLYTCFPVNLSIVFLFASTSQDSQLSQSEPNQGVRQPSSTVQLSIYLSLFPPTCFPVYLSILFFSVSTHKQISTRDWQTGSNPVD